MSGASATPTDKESVADEEEVDEEEVDEEVDEEEESPRAGEGRPREGEEWPDEEDVGRDTVDITNLCKNKKGKAKAKLCKEAERSLGSQSSGRRKARLSDKLTLKMQGLDTVGNPYL